MKNIAPFYLSRQFAGGDGGASMKPKHGQEQMPACGGAAAPKPPSFRFNVSPRAWLWLACILLIASTLRGIRFPSYWALNKGLA